MGSSTFKAKQPIPFAEFAADVARRQAEFGPVEAPRNAGNRRTESKRALLRAIEDAGGKW
jgi:hypothetical protein